MSDHLLAYLCVCCELLTKVIICLSCYWYFHFPLFVFVFIFVLDKKERRKTTKVTESTNFHILTCSGGEIWF